MWTRRELKTNAKMILKRTYWMSFLACLITSLLSGSSNAGSVAFRSNDYDWDSISVFFTLERVMILLGIIGVVMVCSVLFYYLVSVPVIVGKNRFFMANRENDEDLRDLMYSFTSGSYLHIVKTGFLIDLYTFFWSLLFVIPGIVKRYEYFFVPYLLSEDSSMDTKRAFELSKEMSRGKKWKMFVLDVSFLGWNLLGTLCFGIGLFFVAPYYQAVLAELYAASRADVLQRGITDEWELSGYIK